MPAGVTTTSGNTGTCTGVTVASTHVTMASGSTIPPGGCTIVVTITSSTTGTVTNTTGTLTTSAGTAPPASAPLTVTGGSGVASLTKSFAPAAILPGGTSTLTITIGNAGTGPLVLTAPFTDPDAGGDHDHLAAQRDLCGRHDEPRADHHGVGHRNAARRLHDRGERDVVEPRAR